MNHQKHIHPEHSHEHTIYGELVCHLPYAIFSVALGLAILSFMSVGSMDTLTMKRAAGMLFHSFHFMHLVFAAAGTLLTFFRFSNNATRALILGIISPMVFCTLSDCILPYIGGRMMGVPMTFHLCFFTELSNVIPFLVVGLVNGFLLRNHYEARQELYSIFSHATHILVSSLASLFYLVSNGFSNWYTSIGMVFMYLVVAVVVPCTLSDVVVPLMVAKADKKR